MTKSKRARWPRIGSRRGMRTILKRSSRTMTMPSSSTSPAAAQLLGTPDGKVTGKANLRAYFQRGLEAYPDLHFHLKEVLCGVTGIVLYYKNQKGSKTAEFMEVNASGKVTRVVANYGV